MTSPASIQNVLRAHEKELQTLRLHSLKLFGSAARDRVEAGSDLDFLYRFEEGNASLDRLEALRTLLQNILGRDIDLVPEKYVGRVLREAIGDQTIQVYGTRHGP